MQNPLACMQQLIASYQGYERFSYIQKIEPYLGTNLIKVITGQRRCGKSYIMRSIIKRLGEKLQRNVLYINYEIDDFTKLNTKDSLLAFFTDEFLPQTDPQQHLYVFLDEVQECVGWEKVVTSLLATYTDHLDIVISGSNSHLLSSELSTYLSGRYVEFLVLPFLFDEYLAFAQTTDDLMGYLKKTGMPEAIKLQKTGNSEMLINYFRSLQATIILKDIVQRWQIKDAFLLERLFLFLVDNTGNFFSLNAIVTAMHDVGVVTNHNTLGTYLGYLESTYVVYGVTKYDLKGKKIFQTEKKYYLNDLGRKNYLTSNYDLGLGRSLENYVFLLLKRYGYQVFVGKVKTTEIDFIANK